MHKLLIPSYQKCPLTHTGVSRSPADIPNTHPFRVPNHHRETSGNIVNPVSDKKASEGGSRGQGQADPQSVTLEWVQNTRGRELTPGVGSEAIHCTPT